MIQLNYDSTIYCIYRQCYNILEYVVQLLQYPKILPHYVTVNFNITLLLQYNATHHSIIRQCTRQYTNTKDIFFLPGLFSWTVTILMTAGEGRELPLLLSTTSISTQTLRHLFITFRSRLSEVFYQKRCS